MDFLKRILAVMNPANADTAKSKAMNVVYAVTALVVAVKAAWDYFGPMLSAATGAAPAP